jgi:phosphate starvation-inducible PhoH-like protein
MSKSKRKNNGNANKEVRQSGKKGRKAQQQQRNEGKARHKFAEHDDSMPVHAKREVKPISAKNERQADYIHSINENTITFGAGPAGTGKTYVATGLAIQALESKLIERIVITRPIVDCDEEQGFLPGDLEEKFAANLEPFWDVLYERLGENKTKYLMEQGRIITAPLGKMRGRTFKNAWVILDEAQNTTKKQMEMFLTRMGVNTKLIINGDLRQVDLERDVISGLRDGMKRLRKIPSIGVVEFRPEDSVRHGMLRQIIDAYAED